MSIHGYYNDGRRGCSFDGRVILVERKPVELQVVRPDPTGDPDEAMLGRRFVGVQETVLITYTTREV